MVICTQVHGFFSLGFHKKKTKKKTQQHKKQQQKTEQTLNQEYKRNPVFKVDISTP